jgi:hypothetical protein
MYGQTTSFGLPVFSLKCQPILVPAEITPIPEGVVFRFDAKDDGYNVCGTLTVRTDAGAVTEIEFGTREIDEQIEIGDWGIRAHAHRGRQH